MLSVEFAKSTQSDTISVAYGIPFFFNSCHITNEVVEGSRNIAISQLATAFFALFFTLKYKGKYCLGP